MREEAIFKRGAYVDRYEIRELLGVGGQAQVYRARDPVLKRPVVIKALGSMAKDCLGRFRREAEAISQLSHNNVVAILDFRVEGGRPYIVMEYLEGKDLAARLHEGPMEVAEVVDVMLAVCSGVFACHRRGVIHRDLKPRNVFLAESEVYGRVVKVLDFGIARVAQSGEITQVGLVVGTPRYMAPEQLRTEPIVDEKTDQYGVGMLLYVALTRVSPYEKLGEAELVRAVLKGEYPGPRKWRPEIPKELEQIILKAMAVDRAERFESLHQLGQELLRFSTPGGRTVWREHFMAMPRLASVLPATDISAENVLSDNRTTGHDVSQPATTREKGLGEALTRVVEVDPADDGTTNVLPRGGKRSVPAQPLQEIRGSELPRESKDAAAAMLATTTKDLVAAWPTEEGASSRVPSQAQRPAMPAAVARKMVSKKRPPGGKGSDERRLRRWLAIVVVAGGLVGVGVGSIVAARFGPRKILDAYAEEAKRVVIGWSQDARSMTQDADAATDDTGAEPESDPADLRPNTAAEDEKALPASRKVEASALARAEGRKKKTGAMQKRTRVQFLDDGSPLLE